MLIMMSCILSKFHIKPQLASAQSSDAQGCILSKFHIKPQQCPDCLISFEVVSYRNSTSNHNFSFTVASAILVVSYRNSTSNHNPANPDRFSRLLYLIEIPHQTTTYGRRRVLQKCCILSKFHIKPQLRPIHSMYSHGCILSKFHIKPQQPKQSQHRTVSCILSKFHIKPQLRRPVKSSSWVVSYRNSTSNHNLTKITTQTSRVVSYRNSTSNHN